MAAATGIWLSAGAAAVTMDRIAADLGMSKKTLYKLYGSKRVLWSDIVNTVFAEVGAEAAALAEGDYSPQERFALLATMAGKHLSTICGPQAELRRLEPEVWSEVELLRNRHIEKPLAAAIREAGADGSLRPEVDQRFVEFLVPRLIAMLSSSPVLAEVDLTVGQVLEQTTTVLTSGLFGEPAKPDATSGGPDAESQQELEE